MAALGPLEAVTLLSVIRIMVLKVFGSPVGGLKTSPSLPLPMAARQMHRTQQHLPLQPEQKPIQTPHSQLQRQRKQQMQETRPPSQHRTRAP